MLLESIEMEWMSMSTGDAENAASATGDLPRLSPVDLEILAIALATGQTLYTDDYSLQNVCRNLNHPFEAVSNKRSQEQWSWELRCIGCRATKKADSQDEKECDVCGSIMKVKRAR